MSEFYGDNGEVWDGEDDDPMLGGMGKPYAIRDRQVASVDLVKVRPFWLVRRRPWYVRLWRWMVGGYPAS